MWLRILLVLLLITISVFCWISFINPVDIDFHFFGKVFPTNLPTLMISSFVLGALLVFISTLARDAKRAIEQYQLTRQKRKSESLREEFNKGMDHFLLGNFSKAKSHFIDVLKKDPSKIDLYFRLSEISLKEGNTEEALSWLERARLFDMRNVEVLVREAELYQHERRFNEAIRVLNRAIRLDETHLEALKKLRELYILTRQWEEAIRIQKAILKQTKEKKAEEETLFYLGMKYEYANDLLARGGERNLEEALKEAKEIIRERKTFEPGFVLLGDIYLRKGKWTSAGRIWGRSFSRFKSIIFILRLEDLYMGQGDPSTLLKIYQRILRHDPDNWVVSFFYAKLCLRLEMLDEALEEINEISLRVKDFPALHRLLAEIYLHKKDFHRAAQEFKKTFEMSATTYLPFFCKSCERESKEWIAYCPKCHQWGTYNIKEVEKAISLTSPSFSEPAHLPLGA